MLTKANISSQESAPQTSLKGLRLVQPCSANWDRAQAGLIVLSGGWVSLYDHHIFRQLRVMAWNLPDGPQFIAEVDDPLDAIRIGCSIASEEGWL